LRSGVTSTLLYYRSPWTLANFGEGIDVKDKISVKIFFLIKISCSQYDSIYGY
jgi:hypothetical protein